MPESFEVGRYHSWLVDRRSMPAELIVTAIDMNGDVMAMRHERYDIHGVQFHPESVLTPDGDTILANFINH